MKISYILKNLYICFFLWKLAYAFNFKLMKDKVIDKNYK